MSQSILKRLKELRGSPDAIIVPRDLFNDVVEIFEEVEDLRRELMTSYVEVATRKVD